MDEGRDPQRALYAFDVHCQVSAMAWSRGVRADYSEFIACARKVLGADVQHLPNWEQKTRMPEPRGGEPYPEWSPQPTLPWDHDSDRWRKMTIPEARLVPLR